MTNEDGLRLLKKAYEAAKSSYSPYSHFRVGACLLCDDGSEFSGCNIENAAYSATVCAERTAVFEAVKAGKKNFAALAVVSPDSDGPCFPCGECRQVLEEFCGTNFLLVVDCGGLPEFFKMNEILPRAFGPTDKEEA